MSELRSPPSDRPDDRPPDSPAPIDTPTARPYDPRDLVEPRSSLAEQAAQLPERPQLLALKDKVRAESADRFEPSDAEKLADNVHRPEQRDPEQLHAFGNKERPRPPRLERDLKVESWDEVVGPFAPTAPTDEVLGASTYIDPFHPDVRLAGQYHRLPPDYRPPEGSGLAIHADGRDVDDESLHGWGHRTIYPTEPMTAAEFAQRVVDLPWEHVGKKERGT